MYEIIRIILIIVIVTISYLVTSYIGLFGIILEILLLSIAIFITNKNHKPTLIRSIVVIILAIILMITLIIIISLIDNYLIT